MMLALDTVAWVYSIAALICFIDVFKARWVWRKLVRFFMFAILCVSAYIYASAYLAGLEIPPPVLRYSNAALPVVLIGEVISLWNANRTCGGYKK